ncbi:MAG: hypothetical protein COB04_05405 [Gammaproteobacteria bacterium]|nr:MAG: hypothetical protein COB04_05405 [Gammaproteobacteria bacterium]
METSQYQADIEGEILVGHYIYGHEVNSFKPCGHKYLFWVLGSEEVLDLLAEKYSNYVANPYDEVYIKIAGNYLNKASDGFAVDYDGQVQVEKVFLMRKKSNTDCR